MFTHTVTAGKQLGEYTHKMRTDLLLESEHAISLCREFVQDVYFGMPVLANGIIYYIDFTKTTKLAITRNV